MDGPERLRFESPALGLDGRPGERPRFALAAYLCRELRVLELRCGTGGGSVILAERARLVHAVDPLAAHIEAARALHGGVANLTFAVAEPGQGVEPHPAEPPDALVCLNAPQSAEELEALLAITGEPGRFPRWILTFANGAASPAPVPGGITAQRASELAAARGALLICQVEVEGSLFLVPGRTISEGIDPGLDWAEPASHFVLLAGFDAEEVDRARAELPGPLLPAHSFQAHARLGRELQALRAENARLTREHLGRRGAAAAESILRLTELESERADLEERLRLAQRHARELEQALASAGAPPPDEPARRPPPHRVVQAVSALPLPLPPGEDPNSWQQRHLRAANVLIPWVEQTVPLAGRTVLEYGCGNGPVTCALAARAARVIGVDIDADGLELAAREVAARRLGNVELELHGAGRILDAVAARRGQVDVFLFYAVLEHLTISERLAVLALAREVVRPGGAIVVCEAPNRLVYFDHHTAQMPFFHLLEEELALRYSDRIPRRELRQLLERAAAGGEAEGLQTLRRLGRGVSFHEFELVFGDLSRHVIASNYDPLLFGERPVHPDEVILARYLSRLRPDLAPVWSRYWLDLILSPQPVVHRMPWLRPWLADTSTSRGVGWTGWENLALGGLGSTLWLDLPHPTSRLVLGSLTDHGRELVLTAYPAGGGGSVASRHRAGKDVTAFSTFELAAPVRRIALEASDHCQLAFVGYEE